MSVHPNTADDQVNVGIVGQIWDSSVSDCVLAESRELTGRVSVGLCFYGKIVLCDSCSGRFRGAVQQCNNFKVR
jgi:hypothetical protein